MESTKGAWIIGGATVLAAVIGGLFLLHKSSPTTMNFSGEVRNTSGVPVPGARVLLAEDQQTPESTYSDENGVFHVVLPESEQSLKITVTASGYNSITRDVHTHRTGPEEFVLQPTSAAEPPSGGLTTNGQNSPIVNGDHDKVVTGHDR